MSENNSTTEIEPFEPKVRWIVPQRLDFMTFVGRDVFAVAHDIYISFINFKTKSELVYVANDETSGDGVDLIAGYKSNMFAFAEKVEHARIFIVNYPSFAILAELRDNEVNRYKGLCLMEGDLVAAFSGFPNYLVSIWSWRTGQRLLSLPTGVVRRRQMYTASRTHMLVCECWGEGLIVWEVAPCYRRCFMLKRPKEEVTGWETSSPPLRGVCWTSDGHLYAIDGNGYLYSVSSDGIGMVSVLEWSHEFQGSSVPLVCAFGPGIIIYCPDGCLRWLKKAEQKWKVAWQQSMPEEVERLVGNATGDVAAVWTRAGRLLRLSGAGDGESPSLNLVAYKHRNITRVQLIAPDFKHLAVINDSGVICVYEVITAKAMDMKYIEGNEVSFQASPVDPLLVVFGEEQTSHNYGLALLKWDGRALKKVGSRCLTHQCVSRVAFSATGREMLAAAMSAGHLFLFKVSESYNLTLLRYTEFGRGLADCFLMKVGPTMRAFGLVLFSDKYVLGERIICINAETGKDNKFAGKMQGPYTKLLALTMKDSMLAIPHLSRQFHILKLSGEKGVTVSVKMGPIVESGHELKQFSGFRGVNALITFGADGAVMLRSPLSPADPPEFKMVVSHRYEAGINHALMDADNSYVVHQNASRTLGVVHRYSARPELRDEPHPEPPAPSFFDSAHNTITIISSMEKNYLDLQEEKRVREEALDFKKQRDDVLRLFESLQSQLVALLEENLQERPLHQLSLSEFNLHQENKKERLKQAEKEREDIRLQTEARIRAQDKVTAWIKQKCWDTMLTPRVKLFAIFSHYQVENYPVLPTQREQWPELQQTEALRLVEMENDADLFQPWVEVVTGEPAPPPADVTRESVGSMTSVAAIVTSEEPPEGEPYVLSGSNAHRYITVPPFMIPQTVAFSFLQMNWLYHIVKLNVQNMRLWFNKQFDELMTLKRREVGLVEERNARLRFIIEELNKLSDLRGSFHHLMIQIHDPEWRQEEQPIKLIKVEPEECSIPPYISPSQIVVVPPDPGPKDDFRERALNEMMDGVLEKLWHEEIKKPIPMPQCMLDKEPEQFTEDDLRLVFDYEAKVKFRNEERDKYRKMLHAEYAKLSQVLNEGVVKFNMRVKEMWLTKLRVDSVIGQENLNLMRLRRSNLDRVEAAEQIEDLRERVAKIDVEAEALARELTSIGEQSVECQAAYDALAQKDRQMERTFKNHFADLSPIVIEQCYKFFKKRPKWHQRASMTPAVLYELATAVLAGVRPPLLHPDCVDYFKAVDQLDLITNMPAVMDDALWTTMCRLRRAKIENEIRMRGVVLETAYVDGATGVWQRAVASRRAFLATSATRMQRLRDEGHLTAINRTVQLVLPAGQVEIVTTGHMEDFEDAALIPREDIETINNLILKVGAIKLRMMRRQMEFRKGILAKEWEHAQMKMKLRHMRQELYTYTRLKIPKELQWFLKNKEKGYTDEQDYTRLEKEMAANRITIERVLRDSALRAEELQVKISALTSTTGLLEKQINNLNLKVSEKRIKHDPLEPIRVRRIYKKRMETLVGRSRLIREVQANHSAVVLLQTRLELLRLRTYPTLATFRTFC